MTLCVPHRNIEEMLKTAAWDQSSTAVHEATMKRVPQIGFIIDVNVSIHSIKM